MKKLTRKSLDELSVTLSVLSEEEQQASIGGGKESCVFNCFDKLDGDRRTAIDYYNDTLTNLYYEPDDYGGVPFSDIGKIGGFGGFSVNEMPSTAGITLGGRTEDGDRVMMVFRVEEQAEDGKMIDMGHAVIVTGVDRRDGKQGLTYYDPTTTKRGFRVMGNWVALYSVKDNSESSGITEGGSISN